MISSYKFHTKILINIMISINKNIYLYFILNNNLIILLTLLFIISDTIIDYLLFIKYYIKSAFFLISPISNYFDNVR